METNDIKAISYKNTKENIIEENNSYLDIKIKSCLFGIRKVIKGNLDKSKRKICNIQKNKRNSIIRMKM